SSVSLGDAHAPPTTRRDRMDCLIMKYLGRTGDLVVRERIAECRSDSGNAMPALRAADRRIAKLLRYRSGTAARLRQRGVAHTRSPAGGSRTSAHSSLRLARSAVLRSW